MKFLENDRGFATSVSIGVTSFFLACAEVVSMFKTIRVINYSISTLLTVITVQIIIYFYKDWQNKKFQQLYLFIREIEVINADIIKDRQESKSNFSVVKLLETGEIIGFKFMMNELFYHIVLFDNKIHYIKETKFCFKDYRIYKIRGNRNWLHLF